MDQLPPRAQALHDLLSGAAGPGVKVYFQEPPNTGMSYPCILYHKDGGDTVFANNKPYKYTKRYQITVMDYNPDSEIPDRVAMLPSCTHSRSYAADNLNHDVFTLFF